MSVELETQKRLEIAQNISSQLEHMVEGLFLGGSMGYGQNYSVTKESDIDLVIVCKKENLPKLLATPYFQNEVTSEAINLFSQNKITFFWVTKIINDIEVNSFIYNYEKYIKACLLEENVTVYSKKKPSPTQENFNFDGSTRKIDRNVKQLNEGYTYNKFQLYDNVYYSIPPLTDFTRGYIILYQKENLFSQLEDKVWKYVTNKLIEEHGPNVDLNKASILKAEWIYQTRPEKLPPKAIQRILDKTEEYMRKK